MSTSVWKQLAIILSAGHLSCAFSSITSPPSIDFSSIRTSPSLAHYAQLGRLISRKASSYTRFLQQFLGVSSHCVYIESQQNAHEIFRRPLMYFILESSGWRQWYKLQMIAFCLVTSVLWLICHLLYCEAVQLDTKRKSIVYSDQSCQQGICCFTSKPLRLYQTLALSPTHSLPSTPRPSTWYFLLILSQRVTESKQQSFHHL